MKKILLNSIFAISVLQGHTQSFILLANDPSGDVSVSFVADAQSLSYSMDIVQDSIWFKVQTYTAVNPNADVGMMFGFDTNLVITDGLTWNGNNNSMKYDIGFLIFQNSISPNYYGYLYTSMGSVAIAASVERPDNYTFIINTRLSLLDQDGSFNLLFGMGAFDILATRDVYDDVPNSGYLTVSPTLGAGDIQEEKSIMTVYPNPAVNEFTIYDLRYTIQKIEIYNALGKEIFSPRPTASSQRQIIVDVSEWKTGIYFIAVTDDKNNRVFSKIVKE